MSGDAFIEEVRRYTDIVNLVEEYGITLKKTGKDFQGLCQT